MELPALKASLENVLISDDHSFLIRYDHIRVDEEMGCHTHPEIELQYVLQGSGVHLLGKQTESCSAGEVILIPSNMPHAWFWDEKSLGAEGRIKECTLQFRFELLKQRFSSVPELAGCMEYFETLEQAVEFTGETAVRLREVLMRMAGGNRMERFACFVEAIALIITGNGARYIGNSFEDKQTHRENRRLEKVYRFMMENYCRTITLEEVASLSCMNKSAFCTFFKREAGKSFTQLINEYRINRACLLLCEHRDRSVSDICYSVGFSDVSHFNRVFKRQKGCSPQQFRSLGG